ncbi:phospholipase D-like domain-containing protein DpdK [Klebsiella pneumoniae]
MEEQRQIFLHGPLGQRQLREVLSAQFCGLILYPELIWLISPWISDFDIIDNRGGQWSFLDPSWGARMISFQELLATAANNGCPLRIVTRPDTRNKVFVERLLARLSPDHDVQYTYHENLHAKDMLTKNFLLRGSMNYTWSGANLNDEHLLFSTNKTIISDTLIELSGQYTFGDRDD